MALCHSLLIIEWVLGRMTSNSLFKFMINDYIILGVNVDEKELLRDPVLTP